MLTENKFSKYFLYAVGEITLVVIGILIALSINNWNEQNKNLAKEQVILEQLKIEYLSNLDQLDEKILMRNQNITACFDILNQIDNPNNINEEKLYYSLSRIVRDPTFDPIKNDIIESENLRLIQNDTLLRTLSIWSSEVFQVQELELVYRKIRTEHLLPCYYRLGVARNVNNEVWKDGYKPTEALDKNNTSILKINRTKKTLNLQNLIEDVELEGILSHAITFLQVTNIQSQALRKRIVYILEIIENEIQ